MAGTGATEASAHSSLCPSAMRIAIEMGEAREMGKTCEFGKTCILGKTCARQSLL